MGKNEKLLKMDENTRISEALGELFPLVQEFSKNIEKWLRWVDLKIYIVENFGEKWIDTSAGLPSENTFDIVLRHSAYKKNQSFVMGTANGNLYLQNRRNVDSLYLQILLKLWIITRRIRVKDGLE